MKKKRKSSRRDRVVEHNGKTQRISDWSKELGLSLSTIIFRLNKEWSIHDTFTKTPMHSLGYTTSKNLIERKTYRAWNGLKLRCKKSLRTDKRKYYYDKGIHVSKEWNTFGAFLKDMGIAPSLKHTIDRIDGNKGYCKENCRWATYTEQNRNRSCTRWITFNGETRSLPEWADQIGINCETLRRRLNTLKWPLELALKAPLLSVRLNEYNAKK